MLKKDSFVNYLSLQVKAKLYDIEEIESLIKKFDDIPSTGFELDDLNLKQNYILINRGKTNE